MIVIFHDCSQQLGMFAMDNSLLKYSAKDHFFKACVCNMCVDLVNAQLSLQKYEDMFPAFSESRECKLVKVSEVTRGSGFYHEWFSSFIFFFHCIITKIFLTIQEDVLSWSVGLRKTSNLCSHLWKLAHYEHALMYGCSCL